MASSITPVAQAAVSSLQAGPSAGRLDPAETKLFADLMRGSDFKGGTHAAAPNHNLLSQSHATTGVAETLQQLSPMSDSADPIKSQMVMLDVFGQRMEALGHLHVVMAIGSGVTNVFKQLFNRHD